LRGEVGAQRQVDLGSKRYTMLCRAVPVSDLNTTKHHLLFLSPSTTTLNDLPQRPGAAAPDAEDGWLDFMSRTVFVP
jgi:hypothetical protein